MGILNFDGFLGGQLFGLFDGIGKFFESSNMAILEKKTKVRSEKNDLA